MNPNKKFSRRYLSKEFNAFDAAQVKAEYEKLSTRNIKDATDLEGWILDWEELSSACNEVYARINVAVTVDTTDKTAEEKFMKLVDEILPLLETEGFKLSKQLLAHPAVSQLPPFYDVFLRTIRCDVELYNEANVPLKSEERKLVNEFEKIFGSFLVTFRGQEMTMQQLAKFLEDPDRATRKEAYEARIAVRQKHAPELDDLYGRMLELRHKIAVNAGFKNFRDYQFKAWHRFDYTPEDCFKFHEAIAEVIVPKVSALMQTKKGKLKVDGLKPYDLQVDEDGSKAILPFKNADELVAGCRKIFHNVDTELGAYFDHMVENKLLDLDSRKGKAPGGYCTQFSETRVPFIFMNAAGTKRDVDTLLHEGGHSFHYYLARELILPTYHHTGLEFAEVASMSMELLSRPYFDAFYKPDEIERVKRDQLKKILEFFPFMAMIDSFQHWVYTSLEKDPKKWREKWASLEKQYQPHINWDGYEAVRDIGWQYPHVFSVPFYYIEYGIAQLGALFVWSESLKDYKRAVRRYKEGLKLGGTVTLPEMFDAIGTRFGMDKTIIQPLVKQLSEHL